MPLYRQHRPLRTQPGHGLPAGVRSSLRLWLLAAGTIGVGLVAPASASPSTSSGIPDIGQVRSAVAETRTVPENARPRLSLLYSWYRLLANEGLDLTAFEPIRLRLKAGETSRNDYAVLPTSDLAAIDEGYRVLEKVQANAPARITTKRGSPPAAPPPPVAVEIETGNAIRVLQPGAEARLAFALRNTVDHRQRFSFAATLENFDGEKLPVPVHTFDLAPGATAAWPLPAPARLGIWWVHYTLTPAAPDAASEPVAGTRSFAYMSPAGPTAGPHHGFRFGLAYWHSGSDDPRTALATALCGADIYRLGGIWNMIEPREGVRSWDRVDKIAGLFAAQNVDLQIMLSFCPPWAETPFPPEVQRRIDSGELHPQRGVRSLHHAPRLDAWRNFVSAAGRHFDGRVRYWEVWNEPDWTFFAGTTAHYLEMLRIAHDELKRLDPQNQVMTGGFAVAGHGSPHMRPNPDLTETVIRDGQDFFDLHSHHEHGPFERFARQIDGEVMPLRAKYLKTPKPLYFTETGVAIRPAASGVATEQQQAAMLVEKIVFAWSRGAVAYNWFCIFDTADGAYGLLTKDYSPKAAYLSYNTLVTLLRGKQFVRQAERPPSEYVFHFADRGEQVVVAWTQSSAPPAAPLLLATDATRAELVDLMGNRAPLALGSGHARIPLGSTPTFVVFHSK